MRRRAPMYRRMPREGTNPNLKKENPDLTQEGKGAQQEVLLSLISPVVRRSAAVFLGTEDYRRPGWERQPGDDSRRRSARHPEAGADR